MGSFRKNVYRPRLPCRLVRHSTKCDGRSPGEGGSGLSKADILASRCQSSRLAFYHYRNPMSRALNWWILHGGVVKEKRNAATAQTYDFSYAAIQP